MAILAELADVRGSSPRQLPTICSFGPTKPSGNLVAGQGVSGTLAASAGGQIKRVSGSSHSNKQVILQETPPNPKQAKWWLGLGFEPLVEKEGKGGNHPRNTLTTNSNRKANDLLVGRQTSVAFCSWLLDGSELWILHT